MLSVQSKGPLVRPEKRCVSNWNADQIWDVKIIDDYQFTESRYRKASQANEEKWGQEPRHSSRKDLSITGCEWKELNNYVGRMKGARLSPHHRVSRVFHGAIRKPALFNQWVQMFIDYRLAIKGVLYTHIIRSIGKVWGRFVTSTENIGFEVKYKSFEQQSWYFPSLTHDPECQIFSHCLWNHYLINRLEFA